MGGFFKNSARQAWHFFIRALSCLIRSFIPINKNLVLCESFGGFQYACNPKYITEYILANYPEEFHIVWIFENPMSIKGLDNRIVKVKKRTLKELVYINTAEFIFTNIRWNDLGWGWKKRKGQKYIMSGINEIWNTSLHQKRGINFCM